MLKMKSHKRYKLVRFAHNWNTGILECWNTGFWEIEEWDVGKINLTRLATNLDSVT